MCACLWTSYCWTTYRLNCSLSVHLSSTLMKIRTYRWRLGSDQISWDFPKASTQILTTASHASARAVSNSLVSVELFLYPFSDSLEIRLCAVSIWCAYISYSRLIISFRRSCFRTSSAWLISWQVFCNLVTAWLIFDLHKPTVSFINVTGFNFTCKSTKVVWT